MTEETPSPARGSSGSPKADAANEEVAAALEVLRRDSPTGLDALIPIVYAELRRIAHRQLASESAGHTLSTTALVHEAYMRLADQRSSNWVNPGQFFALAARVMRRVLIDYARRHQATRRGGGDLRISLDDVEAGGGADADSLAVAARGDDLLALDEALDRLSLVDPRAARVVECRFFGGLSEEETALAIGVSTRTVASDWRMARGWLYRMLNSDEA